MTSSEVAPTSCGPISQVRLTQAQTAAFDMSTAMNAAGQVTSVTTALSKTTTLGYDRGDLVSVQTPLGHTTTRFTDGVGRVLRAIDPLGSVTSFEYNAHNQITKITDARGGETTFTYDGNGNLLTLTDARNKTTTWTYNNMDRAATRADPLTRQETFGYDLNGNLTTWTDRKAQVTSYTYDALDRPTFIGFGTTGTPATYASTITTTYDGGDRPTQVVDSGAGTITRTYDLLDRLTQEVTPEGTISYTYDAANRRATSTVTGQTAVSYTYDNADRLTALTQGTATVSMSYNDADRRSSLTLPNGIVMEYGYDDDSRLIGLTYKQGASTIGTLTYGYDANGQRASVGGTWARTSLPSALTSATYDDANQIATWAGTSFTYDNNGNLTSDGTRPYTWNARNELTGIGGGASATFAYDGFGRRRARTVSGTTQFLYDVVNPVQELSSGSPIANVLSGLAVDEYFRRIDASTTRYYLADALGSTTALADNSGAVQTSYTFEPFGSVSVSGAATTNTIGFTSREIDGTGLYYYRMRYYHPQLARFISEDPLQLVAGDVNFYAYVRNTPIDLVDPLGLRPLTDCEKDKLKDYIPKEDLDNADITEGKVPWYTPEDVVGITRGKKIYFRAGAYNPARVEGIALLGHELFHVGQIGLA
ncbi:MAG: RHS repeat-associated core domain-containing protein [Vicinamibacterales bacterium]